MAESQEALVQVREDQVEPQVAADQVHSPVGQDPEAVEAAEPVPQELLVRAALRASPESQSAQSARSLSSARHRALAVRWSHAVMATRL